MITRRSAIGAMSGAACVRGAAGRKTNFVFIIGDDHAGYVLGAHGNKLARTPNLDRLASEGVRFASHYCNSPVCTPSRQSTFTGQLPHSAGVTVLSTALSDAKPTLAKQLKKAGYTTAVFGKMHFNRRSEPGLHGVDYLMAEDLVNKNWSTRQFRQTPPDIKTKPRWRPFQDPASIWLNSGKLPYPRYYDDMRDTFIARQAVDFLKQHRDETFALWVSLSNPHSPFDFPVDFRDEFDPKKFDVPRVGPEDAWQVPLIFRDLTLDQKQGIIAAYYTSTFQLDRNIGEVLNALRDLKLEEDTLVVYLGDNGYSLGHHGRFEKHCGYEPAIHVPLIMRLPGRVRKGAVVRDLTETVDVPHTILDMLSAEPLPVRHGQSLRPYLEGKPHPSRRDHVFSEYLENEEAFIRTERWKFMFGSGKRVRDDGYKTDKPAPGRTIRLFDLKNDPGEFTDLAAKHADVVAEMQKHMLKRFRDTHPDAASEPKGLADAEAIEFYVRPRDAGK